MYVNNPSRRTIIAVVALSLLLFSCTGNNDKKEETRITDPKLAKLKLPEGFHAEHLFGPSENEDGSWVSMTFDDKGRLIASDQYGGLYRMKLPPIGDTSKPVVEKLMVGLDTIPGTDSTRPVVRMGYAHGLLYAFNSLYVMINHRSDKNFEKGSGLYRLQDTDGDDQFDKITLLKALDGEGEHGPHSIVLSPDKQSLYVIAGNFTKIPEMNKYTGAKSWQIDNLLPLIKDPNGHDDVVNTHGGWIAHIDSTGKDWELIANGFRNPFDLAFNDAGDMFTFDSDMEWDFGTPWYRPTRICHVTSGGEFGWRQGTDKWSPEYPDNLPPVLNIGQGSPTNVFYGGNARFPEKYRKAIYAFDWSFGIIYAIHLEADGSSYKAKGEEFISGSPLPLTDGVIGPDGALYFMTGGRRLESDLYRVYYGDNTLEVKNEAPAPLTEEQKIRRHLETFHGDPKPDAVATAWPYLKHSDRFIRYAARVVLEHQPAAQWQDKVFKETDPETMIQAAVALARTGSPVVKDRIINALTTIDYKKLSASQQIDLLRAVELVLLRMGMPDAVTKAKLGEYLDAQYPAATNNLNRSLSKVLVYIDAPQAVEKTMALLATAKDDPNDQKTFTQSSDLIMRNPQYGMDIAGMLSKVPPQQQTYYAVVLSEAANGWTPELRDKYFKWFYTAFGYKGGHSFRGFINLARKNALTHVPKSEFAHFNTISGDSIANRSGNELADNAPSPKGPGRRWKVDEAVAAVDSLGLNHGNFEQGKAMFAASMCIYCHTMKGEGGVAGPDLTQLGSRFSTKDILEAIIEPDKTISDQYGATVFSLKDGGSVTGRLVKQDDNTYYISQNPFAPQDLKEVSKKSVQSTRISEVSPMLPGMINRLNPEELRDLMAYLISGGNKDNAVYTGKGNNADQK
ncbi:MAG: c-type cytochrome [Sphingobacteriales bacterium]|nr:c-type cytochrome [Sphingobacteriales bacterium]OJY84430.1 MAG: heme-binding protein [Sphingobacteriales bacterium 44-15]